MKKYKFKKPEPNKFSILCTFTVTIPTVHWQNSHKSLPGSGTKPGTHTYTTDAPAWELHYNFKVGVPPWQYPARSRWGGGGASLLVGLILGCRNQNKLEKICLTKSRWSLGKTQQLYVHHPLVSYNMIIIILKHQIIWRLKSIRGKRKEICKILWLSRRGCLLSFAYWRRGQCFLKIEILLTVHAYCFSSLSCFPVVLAFLYLWIYKSCGLQLNTLIALVVWVILNQRKQKSQKSNKPPSP